MLGFGISPHRREAVLNLHKIVSELKKERDRLGRAIALLEEGSATAARKIAAPGSPKPRRRRLTAAGRKRLSDLMKQRWAERRKKGN
jgi:hypothetical protein